MSDDDRVTLSDLKHVYHLFVDVEGDEELEESDVERFSIFFKLQ